MDKKAWQNAVEKAIHYLNDNAWNSKNNSTDYDLFYNGKLYPPKEVYKNAIIFFRKTNPDDPIPRLGGGKPTNKFLRELGFSVEPKISEMNYWHIQMHLPNGRNGKSIDPIPMLNEKTPIIGTGEWDDFQCRNFKNEFKDGLQKDNIIMVRIGDKPLALCQVIDSTYFKDDSLESKYVNENFRKVKVLDWWKDEKTKFSDYQGTLKNLKNKSTSSYKFIDSWYQSIKKNNYMDAIIKLIEHKKQIILQGPPGTGKTRLAKQIAEKLTNDNTYSIVQFHPSYSYEDFVRGMRVINEGSQIEYITENKIIAELADKALTNFQNHKKGAGELSRENWIREQFQEFVESIQDEIDKEGKFELNKHVFIFEANDDSFRYTGTAWNSSSNGHRMKYEDLMISYFNDLHSRKAINKSQLVSGSARQHATYYYYVLNRFLKFITKKDFKEDFGQAVELKKYVLIIDEINRANLSSVFGELIYALEYRGDIVQSMYDIDGKRSINLPPNLYIIGTMNTADRSVGHIDYAIRRRFAFVEVLPKSLDETTLEGKKFAHEEFKKVSRLFVANDIDTESKNFEPSEYLSEEFRPEDVWLGHSYFIYEDEGFDVRLKYEIVPILKEYVKDGILKESALDTINSL